VATYAAIVLAGGRGTRLGGVHKPGLRIGDRTLLDRVLDAVRGADPVVVVGPPQPVPPGTVLTREDPPGGGPVAALAAGLAALDGPSTVADPPSTVAVLAADLPFLTADVVAGLLDACTGDGAVLVDDRGRDQYLAGVWRVTALRKALDEFGDPAGGAMRRLVADLDITRVGGGSQTPAPWFDCDDPHDLDEAKRHSHE